MGEIMEDDANATAPAKLGGDQSIPEVVRSAAGVQAEQAEAAAPAESATDATAATDANASASDTSATSQSSNADQSAQADAEVDYSALVPKITVEHEEGSIPDPLKDPAGYADFIDNDLREKQQFRNTEIRNWQALEKEFPEVKTDPELRQNILARRLLNVQTTGQDSGLIEAGRQVLAPITAARTAGKTDAQVSIEEQQTAGVNNGSQPRDEQTASRDDLMTKFRRGDATAGQSLVEQMLKDGTI
jgi:hypothetical protein